jgi:hypothetical protein
MRLLVELNPSPPQTQEKDAGCTAASTIVEEGGRFQLLVVFVCLSAPLATEVRTYVRFNILIVYLSVQPILKNGHVHMGICGGGARCSSVPCAGAVFIASPHPSVTFFYTHRSSLGRHFNVISLSRDGYAAGTNNWCRRCASSVTLSIA